jgi:anaerobic selenocysteine-containing dehydrogenase
MTTKTVKSTCQLDCPDACALLVDVDEDTGRVVALRGSHDHPFTAGALCGKVNRSVDGLYGRDRLAHPLARVGKKGEGRFERISWDDALETIAARLEECIERYGPASILPLYFSGTMGHVQSWVFGPRFFAHLGASRLDPNMCDGAAVAACSYLLGDSVGYDPEDIVHARLIVLWGINTLTTNLHQWKFIGEAQRRGGRIVAIDPIRTDTAARCDHHLAPLPGTDGALALGLMRTIVDEGAADRDWLGAFTVGWPSLEKRLAEWPVSRAAEICGLDESLIASLGRDIAHTRPTALRVGLGLQRTGGGGAAIRAIMALPALTGDWRYVGGGALNQTLGHFPYRWGGYVEPEGMPAPPARTVNISRVGEALTALDDPPVMATVVWNYNPVASNPNQNRVLAGFKRDDLFVAAIEHRHTDTTDYADIVLPATSHFEHLDIVDAYGHNYLGWNAPAAAAYGESLSNAEIFRRLARRLGIDDPRVVCSELELIEELLDNDACRRRGITSERLRDNGFLRAAEFDVGVAPFANGGFPTPSGKVELWSAAARDDGLDPLVGYTPPIEVGDRELAKRFPFVLITPATRYFLNSTFASLDWHRGKSGPIRVMLNPADAVARGIKDGAQVRVYNDRGAFHAAAVITDRARPGVAMAPKQYWLRLTPGAATPNATTPERDADMAGAPTFHDNRVDIEVCPG